MVRHSTKIEKIGKVKIVIPVRTAEGRAGVISGEITNYQHQECYPVCFQMLVLQASHRTTILKASFRTA